MLFTIRDENYEYIPIQYNIAWTDEQKTYSDIMVKKEFIDVLTEYCSDCRKIYIWDFCNMAFVMDRGFQGIFCKISEMKCNLLLMNVMIGSALNTAVEMEIKQVCGRSLFKDNINECFFIGEEGMGEFQIDVVHRIHMSYLNKIIENKCLERGYRYLVSSGIYSNMQINLKNLFMDVDNLPYVLYLLWKRVYNEQFDAIIATSKNGVAFASILGEIIGCKVLYFNIGQMFEETYNCSPRIEQGNRYLHIYDMICLGSETKVLNALVSAQGGNVYKSVGIVCLSDLDVVSRKNRYSSLNRVECLVGQRDMKIGYTIFLKNPEEEAYE